METCKYFFETQDSVYFELAFFFQIDDVTTFSNVKLF